MRIHLHSTLVALFGLTGCVHNLEIRNPAAMPVRAALVTAPPVIGVTNGDTAAEGRPYVDVIARSLQEHAVARQVVYPCQSGEKVDYVAAVTVTPEYDGSGWNFLVNFPGFLVWAPAWNGYLYTANPRTQIVLSTGDGKVVDTIQWEHEYEFRQADIGRTWTEISWLEVGAIALLGGVFFTQYDTDQTPFFIEQVAPNYGTLVAIMIANRIAGAPAPPKQ